MYGIVVTGGGARGAYGIGALEGIVKERIDIGAVCGSSVGAINGAVFAQGDFRLARKLWEKITLKDVIKLDAKAGDGQNTLSIQQTIDEIKANSGLSMEPIEGILRELIDEDKLMLSPIDFGLVTYSVTDKKAVELFKADIPKGEIVDYIMASACLPGVKKRVIGDKEYLDGGFADNKPVGMLVKKGYRDIIVVDVGGIGVEKQTANNGVNIIEIKCTNPAIGIMEFNKDKIAESINCGYIDARRAFGRVMGEKYAIKSSEYIKARRTMSADLLTGTENAAEFLGIYKLREYKMCEITDAISTEYNRVKKENENVGIEAIIGAENKQILFVKAVEALKNGNAQTAELAVKILLKDFSLAANAVRYYNI